MRGSLAAITAPASSFSRIALANIRQEYPHKLDHVMNGAGEVAAPRVLHPLFYGSYDWHSSVHMHWVLARLLRYVPDLPGADAIRSALDSHFTVENVAAELAYLNQPSRQSFERTYGWAWLLKLQTELIELARIDTAAPAWRNALQPLADAFVERYVHFLPLAQLPIRAGTHGNSAFGLMFALEYAQAVQHLALKKLIASKATAWFGNDRRYPASYEPGGDDFLSGGLMEAALMRRVLDECGYADWWDVFCPDPEDVEIWLSPVTVTDRSDPKLAHLDGLNLSRAWCWKTIEDKMPLTLRVPVRTAIDAHLNASLPHSSNGYYAGTHWLASFALLALSEC